MIDALLSYPINKLLNDRMGGSFDFWKAWGDDMGGRGFSSPQRKDYNLCMAPIGLRIW